VRILLTTTSFQDTPGAHHDLLDASGHEFIRARGPLKADELLKLIASDGPFDATINGDDHFTPKVIDALLPQLRCLGKYGIGLDSIDVAYATSKKLPVLFTPGVNHTTVAEHAIGLMIALSKHFWPHLRAVKAGEWKRTTGNELAGKTLAVLGVGRIGKALIERARAFEMTPIGYDLYWDDEFAAKHDVKRCDSIDEALQSADVISLHLPMTPETKGLINAERIRAMRDGVMIINTARGGLIVEPDIAEACLAGKLRGYATDVLETEPMQSPHPFMSIDNIIVTPHIGSRTFESVERQAMRAAKNVLSFLAGDGDYIQANKW